MNFASFTRTVNFDDTQLNTTDSLRLSIEFLVFFMWQTLVRACINSLKYQITFKLPTVLKVKQDSDQTYNFTAQHLPRSSVYVKNMPNRAKWRLYILLTFKHHSMADASHAPCVSRRCKVGPKRELEKMQYGHGFSYTSAMTFIFDLQTGLRSLHTLYLKKLKMFR